MVILSRWSVLKQFLKTQTECFNYCLFSFAHTLVPEAFFYTIFNFYLEICDAKRWSKRRAREKRKPLVKIVENLSFMLAQHLTAVKDVIFFWPITKEDRIYNLLTGQDGLSLVFICRENPRRSGILLFADHPRFCRYIRYSTEACPRFSRDDSCHAMFICDRGLEPSNLGDWYWAKSIADRRRRPRRYKFEFSFVGNDRRPSQKSGTRRENRNAPDSPDLSPFIPDDRGYIRFRVFISRQNLGRSGNSKIPDRLGFSRHMKTRL